MISKNFNLRRNSDRGNFNPLRRNNSNFRLDDVISQMIFCSREILGKKFKIRNDVIFRYGEHKSFSGRTKIYLKTEEIEKNWNANHLCKK